MESRTFRGTRSHALSPHHIVETLSPRLRRMSAFYARRSGEDADDLMQEAWLAVFEALPTLDTTIGSPEQHLLKRARWRVLDVLRRCRVRRCARLPEAAEEEMAVASSHFETACVRDFTRHLTDTQKAILTCLLDGKTWREAGDELGCTSANIAYHMRRIRQEYAAYNS